MSLRWSMASGGLPAGAPGPPDVQRPLRLAFSLAGGLVLESFEEVEHDDAAAGG